MVPGIMRWATRSPANPVRYGATDAHGKQEGVTKMFLGPFGSNHYGDYANIKRPWGSGTGRPNSLAVSIHSWIITSALLSAS